MDYKNVNKDSKLIFKIYLAPCMHTLPLSSILHINNWFLFHIHVKKGFWC